MTDAPQTISEARAATAQQKSHARQPLPQLGDGVFLYFGLSSLQRLEEEAERLMPGYQGQGLTTFGVYEQLLLSGNVAAIRLVLDIGLKREGADGKPVPAVDVDLDSDLELPLSEVVEPALTAISWSWFHKTYPEMIAEATAARDAAVAEARKAWKEGGAA